MKKSTLERRLARAERLLLEATDQFDRDFDWEKSDELEKKIFKFVGEKKAERYVANKYKPKKIKITK